jgi:hypothetical protein
MVKEFSRTSQRRKSVARQYGHNNLTVRSPDNRHIPTVQGYDPELHSAFRFREYRVSGSNLSCEFKHLALSELMSLFRTSESVRRYHGRL